MSKKLLGFGVAVSVLSVMLNFGEAEAQMSCVKNDLSEINFVHSDSLGTWKIHDDTSTILSGTGAVDNGKEAFHFIVELGLDNTCRLGPNGGDFSFHFSEKSENTTFESEKCQSIEPEKTRVKKTDHGWLLEENGRILTTGKGNGASAKRLLRAVSKLGFNRICQDNLDPPLVVYFKTARDVTAIDFGPDVQFKNGKFKLAGKSRKEMINNALNWVEKVLSKGADRARLLIRFKKPVTPSDRGALVKRGLIPIFAMDPKTWFVSVTDNGFKKALFTDEIVWAGPVSSNFKISQELVGREPFEYEERDKGLKHFGFNLIDIQRL